MRDTRMKPSGRRRRGATAVEFAVVVPVILLMFFAALEFSRLNMIRHTVDVAAFEGARRGVLPGATVAAVQDRVNVVLEAIRVQAETVVVEPATLSRSVDTVTVTVTVALDTQTWIPSSFVAGKKVSRSCTLSREQF